MRVVSLLNSGADINTVGGGVCYYQCYDHVDHVDHVCTCTSCRSCNAV